MTRRKKKVQDQSSAIGTEKESQLRLDQLAQLSLNNRTAPGNTPGKPTRSAKAVHSSNSTRTVRDSATAGTEEPAIANKVLLSSRNSPNPYSEPSQTPIARTPAPHGNEASQADYDGNSRNKRHVKSYEWVDGRKLSVRIAEKESAEHVQHISPEADLTETGYQLSRSAGAERNSTEVSEPSKRSSRDAEAAVEQKIEQDFAMMSLEVSSPGSDGGVKLPLPHQTGWFQYGAAYQQPMYHQQAYHPHMQPPWRAQNNHMHFNHPPPWYVAIS